MFFSQYPRQADDVFIQRERSFVPPLWQKGGFLLSVAFAFLWIIFIWDYLGSSGWWGNRYDLSPAELVGSICGLFVPVIVMFLVTAYFDRSSQLANEAQQLQSYLNDLVYPTEEGAVYTQALTESLRTQIQEFRTVFSQVNHETQIVRDELKQWIDDLSQIMKHVDTQTMNSVREVAGHIQNLTQMTQQANNQSQQTAQMFIEQADLLAQVVVQADDKMRALSGTLSTHTGDVQNMSHALEVANNRTMTALDNAEQIIAHMNEASRYIEETMETHETNTAEQTKRLFGNLEKVLNVFKNQGALIDNEVQSMANRIGVLSDSLSGHAKGMIQTTKGVVQELNGIDKDFETSTQKMRQLVADMKQDIAQIKTDMETNVQKGVQVFPTAHDRIQTDLLQDATVILDRLQNFSVDMAHIFTPRSEDMLWKKYHEGDQAVFMRHITKTIKASQHKKMRQLYEDNTDFRLAVTRYMAEFEGMTKKAQEGEESKLLMSVLIGSDVGRLYMVLADMIKREA